MVTMEKSETVTLKEIPIRRRGPLRSQTVDTLLHILSLCYADSSHIIQHSDKGGIDTQSVTKDDTPLAISDIVPNDSLCREEMFVDERRVDTGTREGLYDEHVELAEGDHNVSGERKDLSHKSDTNPSYSFDIQNQDNYDIASSILKTIEQQSAPMTPISVTDMMISSPHLTTNKDVEEGEISGELMDFMPEDYLGIAPGLENVGNDMAAVVSKTNRNLVDYSEIAIHDRLETTKPAMQGNDAIESNSVPTRRKHVPPLQSILKKSGTKKQDFASLAKDMFDQNNKKRQGSPNEEQRKNKKAKKSVDPITCPENLVERSDDASQEIVDASSDKRDDANEKKKKRVLTKERKAKKKKKERIQRAEKNRKLGVKRLKLQPVIKEKKITYCRHYLKGRCHEGENCKFSHDMIPLTKSKPCCHFARHTCMKGDDCPFDHQLSKYPCNSHLSKGFCSRGSDCMFSHEAQPESSLNAPNDSKPEHKPSSGNSGSKKQNNVDIPYCEKVAMKSCSVPVSSITTNERILVEPTPKLSFRPPKGISFLSSQEKLPLETLSSPKEVDSEVVQDSSKMTKTPPAAPRGINFLSFGKRPGLDNSNGGVSFNIGKSPLSNLEGDGVKVDQNTLGNNDNQVKSDSLTNGPDSSRKSVPMLPFMSSSLQKALRSTLDFASKFESGVKTSR